MINKNITAEEAMEQSDFMTQQIETLLAKYKAAGIEPRANLTDREQLIVTLFNNLTMIHPGVDERARRFGRIISELMSFIGPEVLTVLALGAIHDILPDHDCPAKDHQHDEGAPF